MVAQCEVLVRRGSVGVTLIIATTRGFEARREKPSSLDGPPAVTPAAIGGASGQEAVRTTRSAVFAVRKRFSPRFP
jgi:hypothetical protein